ncbi:uncharacterized protein E0L32_008764 [Thyridium curvatum]|uniref:Uncharacterized protein n=1 Tax=Thyridium curvatum TaxID=1093900 RepID=A0A507AZB3_9PEZI|nr:uncharacterized protein E0L32_008764 [Thyridium curvatum]TPX10359.1 hypothetical protein E0L32_008764 [Thyridium curvatum]
MSSFDPHSVDLDTASQTDIICYINASSNEYNGHLGARISAIFVILIVSTCGTFFPVLATRSRRLHIPLYVYLFARYFGAGVIIATAFVHLLDPAYSEIGPNTCVGLTGGWAVYSWPPAIVLTSVMLVFLMDFAAEFYVEGKYNLPPGGQIENAVTRQAGGAEAVTGSSHENHQYLHSADQGDQQPAQKVLAQQAPGHVLDPPIDGSKDTDDGNSLKLAELAHLSGDSTSTELAFRQQIAAFLILEFGVVFHSVIIGLNLGVVGDEFSTLYPVLVFHQTFEGLGIGARLSVIPFPSRLQWMPWALCLAYGLTTPISIAIGLGLRYSYNGSSYTANVVSGLLDSISAGILIYTGLVEMLARDFLYNPSRTRDRKRILFMLVSLYLGAGIMALLGKWA